MGTDLQLRFPVPPSDICTVLASGDSGSLALSTLTTNLPSCQRWYQRQTFGTIQEARPRTSPETGDRPWDWWSGFLDCAKQGTLYGYYLKP